jgi:pimeloyl-ACP methyl ester carboxylesterase
VVAGGGFSVDWGLVQPEVATFTHICTYDAAGTAWSDQPPTNMVASCAGRTAELHRVLQNAGVAGPYVLVGFSIGGLVARLFAQEYPSEVAGMVIVDHAFLEVGHGKASSASFPSLDTPPVLISSTPITLGIEDDENFSKLPRRDQELHQWAMSIDPMRPTAEMAAECSAVVDDKTQGQRYPLGDRPLIVIRTRNEQPAYQRLQESLLVLSRHSREVLAAKSSHMVIIDEPEAVIESIREVIQQIK